MTPQDLLVLFQIRGIRARVARDEVQVQQCPRCGNDKWNFEINTIRGLYHAWCCGAKGRASTFIKDYLGKDVNLPVNFDIDLARKKKVGAPAAPEVYNTLESEHIISYLRSRDLGVVDFQLYAIGEGRGATWGSRAVFPLKEYWSQEPIGYIGRAALPNVRPKYFSYWNDGTKYISGYRNHSEIHVVVEGVFDGIRVHQAGMNAAVLGGVTGPQLEEWGARVPPPHYVVVLLDSDAEEQASKLFWRIYPIHEKVKMVPLPEGIDPALLERRVLHDLIQRHVQC